MPRAEGAVCFHKFCSEQFQISGCECVNSALSFKQDVSTESQSLNQVQFRDGADVDLCFAHTLHGWLAKVKDKGS